MPHVIANLLWRLDGRKRFRTTMIRSLVDTSGRLSHICKSCRIAFSTSAALHRKATIEDRSEYGRSAHVEALPRVTLSRYKRNTTGSNSPVKRVPIDRTKAIKKEHGGHSNEPASFRRVGVDRGQGPGLEAAGPRSQSYVQSRVDAFFSPPAQRNNDASAGGDIRYQDIIDFSQVLKDVEADILSDVEGNGFSHPPAMIKQEFQRFRQEMTAPDNACSEMLQKIKERVKHVALGFKPIPGNAAFETKYAFYEFMVRPKGMSSKDYTAMLAKAARVDFIGHAYPAARAMRRQIHVHVGPTNSGKTYHALKRLIEAPTGSFGGPLRLLALEVYQRFTAKGRSACLLSGDNRQSNLDDPSQIPDLFACTVEMMAVNVPVDVCVLDEIQMIGDESRGWAWTNAFCGVQAKELHVCGEARTVPLLRELAALCGDDIQVHRYERLTPLKTGRPMHNDFDQLEKGDCIVAFSVARLHGLRRRVEQKTGRRCAIIYGALPPEIRAVQAALFNDPDNEYDFLVASNAIGMGLNLSIRRLIFDSTKISFDQESYPLRIADVKQIAGRAGRFSTAAQDNASQTNLDTEASKVAAAPGKKPGGVVMAQTRRDHDYLNFCMRSEPEPIKTAGVLPTVPMVEQFSRCFQEKVSFAFLMHQLRSYVTVHSRHHLCIMNESLTVAHHLEAIPHMQIADRLKFMEAPFTMREPHDIKVARALARIVADRGSARVIDIPEIELEHLEPSGLDTEQSLKDLETLHRNLISFLWLSYKYPTVFLDRDMADEAKRLTQQRIEETLAAKDQVSAEELQAVRAEEGRDATALPVSTPPLESILEVDEEGLPADMHRAGD